MKLKVLNFYKPLLVALGAIIALGFITVVQAVLKTEPVDAQGIGACTRDYGRIATQWDHDGRHYVTYSFSITGNNPGAIHPNTQAYIMSQNCTTDNGPRPAHNDLVDTELYRWGGSLPTGARLGVPNHHPGGGIWKTEERAAVTPTLRPPISSSTYAMLTSDHGRPAAHVDDGGRMVIGGFSGDQTIWCLGLNTNNDRPPAYQNCTDIASTTDKNGAGAMLVEPNCPNGATDPTGVSDPPGLANPYTINCSQASTWYRNYIPNTVLTGIINGSSGDAHLRDFYLHLEARNTKAGHFGSNTYITFEYPLSFNSEATLRVFGLTLNESECTEVEAGTTIKFGPGMRNLGNEDGPITAVEFANPDPAFIEPTTTNPPYELNDDYAVGAGYGSGPMTSGDGSIPHYYWSRSKAPSYGTHHWNVWYTDHPTSPSFGYRIKDNAPPGSEFIFKSVVSPATPAAGSKDYSDEICIRVSGQVVKEKVMGANILRTNDSEVRDNQHLNVSLNAYLWPDAGLRRFAAQRTSRYWLAGIWGLDSGDATSKDPNTLNRYNTVAEEGCPGSISVCDQTLPLAYVPANDGSGEPNTATRDGSRTPAGNHWLDLRNENFDYESNSQSSTSCNANRRYTDRCGGIASNSNASVGGQTGNRINNVEISNIHIEARGINMNTRSQNIQGRVGSGRLDNQSSFNASAGYLPYSSQGPDTSSPRWDNVRSPSGSSDNDNFSDTLTSANLKFENTGGSPLNFSDNPNNIGSISNRVQQYGTVRLTSLLQDGQDTANPPYQDRIEPLSYTANLSSVDEVRLYWDEYIEWTQVDDKGHWHTMDNRATRPTGVDRGVADSNDIADLDSFDRGSSEFSHVDHSVRHSCPTQANPNRMCHSHANDIDVFTKCEGSYTYKTGVAYTWNNLTYYTDSVETRYGWRNTAADTRAMPYGSNGQTAQSAFYTNYRNTPAWATTGTDAFWQDTAITNMSNSGSTTDPNHADRWIYNTSDPAYNNRHIFYSGNTVTPSFKTGWHYTHSSSCKYPNGDGVEDGPNIGVDTHYPSASLVYENTSSGSINGHVYGAYGNGATFDGSSDGVLDVGWSWTGNNQRVRYEHTFNDHYRKLGSRSVSGSGHRLYGINTNQPIKAYRVSSIIASPTVSLNNADVFAGGGIDSYFQNSAAGSAFLFTNQGIRNFISGSVFDQYFLNPDRSRVSSDFNDPNNTLTPVQYVFEDYDQLVAGSGAIGSTISGSFNLGQNSNRVYRRSGNLTLGNTSFSGGAGTIIVEGDLHVNGNLSYGASGSTRTSVPSVGFIVTGNIYVNYGVTQMVGSYFTNGVFDTGTHVVSGNRSTSDPNLQLRGLVVANNFNLARQTSGGFNVAANPSEEFIYDGRVAVNSPPGFSKLFTTPAVWNEAVPSD